MEEDDLAYIAIVAIIAIVAMVIMAGSNGVDIQKKDISGDLVGKSTDQPETPPESHILRLATQLEVHNEFE